MPAHRARFAIASDSRLRFASDARMIHGLSKQEFGEQLCRPLLIPIAIHDAAASVDFFFELVCASMAA